MRPVTPEQAFEVYEMTIKNELPSAYADWVNAVANALTTGDESQLEKFPFYAKAVYEMKKGTVAFSDEVKQTA